MKGFCHPDEVFEEKLEHNVRTLMTALKDPTLPLLELQVSNIKLMSVWCVLNNLVFFGKSLLVNILKNGFSISKYFNPCLFLLVFLLVFLWGMFQFLLHI